MFGRLKCHGCGRRSKWPKGTREFQCDSCEYTNFYNDAGEVTSPPVRITNPQHEPAPAQKPFQTFTQPLSEEVPVRADDVFCNRCLNNQRIYTEAVSNYLPDDNHPRYQEYEDKLDDFKADLEKRYPQVCKRCAPRVQQKIHNADYYSKSQQFAVNARNRNGQSPEGQRDDWNKWTMRMWLRILGMVVYASLLAQIAWHMSGIAATYTSPKVVDVYNAPDLASGTTLTSCCAQYKSFSFDLACHHRFSTLIPLALFVNFCMLWYNHGLKEYYDGTYRMEAINGKTEHFQFQVFLLIVRAIGWYKLSDPWVLADLTRYQQYAAHGFMIAVMILIQSISERPIRAEKWKMKGKVMPRPDEVDVFSATAGPAEEQYNRQPSSVPPLRLFARNDKPFPIENLAPKPPRGYSKLDLPKNPPPSPPDSDSPTHDAMDIDWHAGSKSQPPSQVPGFRQTTQPKIRSTYNYGRSQTLGWGTMRNELFGIEDKARAEEERKRKEQEERAKLKYQPPVDPSPFRGRLPQAPMSMERKLRNPVTQVTFKKQPLSKQQDFMKQMRDGIENGRYFNNPKPKPEEPEQKDGRSNGRSAFDFDEDFSPVKSRTRSNVSYDDVTPAKSRTKGSLDLHDSGWRLPSDYQQSTGLEELMAGKAFSIKDVGAGNVAAEDQSADTRLIPLPPAWLIVLGVFGTIGAVAWNLQPVRRALCLWLIQQLGLEGVEV